MPPRSAKGAVARSFVSARGAPDSLGSFLGGMFIQGRGGDNGPLIVMNLKLLQKSSETTVDKALKELNRLVAAVAEEELLAYMPNIVEAVLRNAEHTNATVRAGIFKFLHGLASRGASPALRESLERAMPPLAVAWVLRMNDMDSSVRNEAREAFNSLFSVEVLQKYAGAIVLGLIDIYKTVIERVNGKPLEDDCLDPSSNALYSSVSAMGYMLQHSPAAQRKVVVDFVERDSLQPVLPKREGFAEKNGCIVMKTPLVRSAPLSVLYEILKLKLITPQVHRCVSNALYNAVLENESVVLRRVWELLLLWCGENAENAISFFNENFLRDIINSFTRCCSLQVAEIIYPSIVPLLLPLTRDQRCAHIIDEFADALLQKLNISVIMTVQEWQLVLSALMKLWELLYVRAGRNKDGTAMFRRILVMLVSAANVSAKQESHLDAAVSVVAQSMVCVAKYNECFCECVQILCGSYDALCEAVPTVTAAPALTRNFELLQSRSVGAIVAAEVAASSAVLHEATEKLILRYTHEKQWGLLAELLRGCSRAKNSLFVPGNQVRSQVTEGLLNATKQKVSIKQENEEDAEKGAFSISLFEELFLLVLKWGDCETRENIQAFYTSAPSEIQWVGAVLRTHDMKDPKRLFCIFLQACEDADFCIINRCVSAFNEMKITLSAVEKQQLRQAVQQSMDATLQLVSSDDGDCVVSMEASIADSSTKNNVGPACDDNNEEKEEEENEKNGDKEDHAINKGLDVQQRLVGLSGLLRKGGSLATLLDFTAEHLNLATIFHSVVAVAPQLRAEQYISIKALRVALQDDTDPLLQAMSRKTHSLSVNQFNTLVARVKDLLDSYEISEKERDTVSFSLFDDIMRNPCSGIAACSQLSRLLPFASNSLLQDVACSADLWAEQEVLLRDKNVSVLSLPCAMIDRYWSLDIMNLSLLRCVRTAQLVHLLGVSVPIEVCDAVAVMLPLLHAARVQEALANQIRQMLMTKLLPRALLRPLSPEDIKALLAGDTEPHFLLCTLVGVFCDIASHDDDMLVANARCLASVATEWITTSLLFGEGTAPVHAEALVAYRAFFTFLDEMADIVGKSILSSIPEAHAAAVQEAMCMLPELDREKALLVMTIHRHLGGVSVVVLTNTVQQIIAHAQCQRPLDGLEFLSELASSRIVDTTAYNGLVNTIIHMMASACRLRHMPPNGRLMSQATNELPMSLNDLCRVVVNAVLARRGAILHGRVADILRSSVNLILFDAVTECVVSLRQTRDGDLALVTRLIAFTSSHLASLITSDVAVLRSSEASVLKVANVMNYAYQWLCATSIAKLENIGLDNVASSISAVALLSHLTLMRSSVALHSIINQVTSKRLLKNLRSKFTTTSAMKINAFMRHAVIISKTNKQKLALFLHLLAWCVTLSGPFQEDVTREQREDIFHLLDLLCSLLLTPAGDSNGRLCSTFLGSSKKLASDGEQLGFATVALTRSNAAEPMKELARGAAATFALLLQCNTLPIVRSWLETVEQKLQDLFYVFVETHISPVLAQESLLDVLSKSRSGKATFDVSENYNVDVNVERKVIELKYKMDEVGVTVQIAFPSAFPLRHPIVNYESGRECGVSAEKWKSWMLKMTTLLFGNSFNVWECISLFGKNLDAHFAGHEPCPICLVVLSAKDHRLPDVRCSVCRNTAIHSSCLYSWWKNNSQTVCPLCRSSWVSI